MTPVWSAFQMGDQVSREKTYRKSSIATGRHWRRNTMDWAWACRLPRESSKPTAEKYGSIANWAKAVRSFLRCLWLSRRSVPSVHEKYLSPFFLRSLVVQRLHRIDLGSAISRDESCGQCDQRQHERRRDQHGRIIALHLVEQRFGEMSEADCGAESENTSDQRHASDLA